MTGFFERLLAAPPGTFDFQRLRIAGPGAASAVHADIVFMGRGTKHLYTCWTPLGDVSLTWVRLSCYRVPTTSTR